MLSVKLLKIHHAGEGEASKLEPYIDNSDVFSPENPALTEKSAFKLEDQWESLLHDRLSHREIELILRYCSPAAPTDEASYGVKQHLYIYDKRIHLFYSERFKESEAKRLCDLKKQSDENYDLSIRKLLGGDVDNFFNLYEKGLLQDSELTEIRDKEIARNIDQAEYYLRERYHDLSSKRNLRLTVSIGALHFPEKYTQLKIEVVDLVNRDPTRIVERLDSAIRSGQPFEEMKPIVLAYCGLNLSLEGKINLNEGDIQRMSYNNLRRYFEALRK